MAVSAPQGSVLGPVLLNIFTINIDERIKCTLGKIADNTKLLRVMIYLRVGRLCRRIWIVWIDGLHPSVWHSMRLSARCCTCVTITSCSGKRWEKEWLENCMVEKDLEVMVGSWPNMSQKRAQVVKKTKSMLTCIRNSVDSRTSKVIVACESK